MIQLSRLWFLLFDHFFNSLLLLLCLGWLLYVLVTPYLVISIRVRLGQICRGLRLDPLVLRLRLLVPLLLMNGYDSALLHCTIRHLLEVLWHGLHLRHYLWPLCHIALVLGVVQLLLFFGCIVLDGGTRLFYCISA